MMIVTTAAVKSAIRRYNAGERPFRFTSPRAWYLVGLRGRLYPLKYIYALASGQTPISFNTFEAVREFRRLGFELKREPKDFNAEFMRRVDQSLRDPAARAARLAKAPKKPKTCIREVVVQERNPDVVAETLARANGVCQSCKKPAPFRKRSNGDPYLEVHHIKQLAHGGDDSVENAIAVCPNCHRKYHHG